MKTLQEINDYLWKRVVFNIGRTKLAGFIHDSKPCTTEDLKMPESDLRPICINCKHCIVDPIGEFAGAAFYWCHHPIRVWVHSVTGVEQYERCNIYNSRADVCQLYERKGD